MSTATRILCIHGCKPPCSQCRANHDWNKAGGYNADGEDGNVWNEKLGVYLAQHVAREMAKGFADAVDTVYCRTHGNLSKSRREAVQVERDETCVYACSHCGAVCDEIPF